jgi:predicted nuclease of predicted toxin-antitoxin system
MKVLLDTCVWGGSRATIVAAGHDVIGTADYWKDDPGDREILARAHIEGRVLVTLDKDFGELIFAENLAHCGVIRLADVLARQQGPLCVQVLAAYEAELKLGALIVASLGRVRIRMPQSGEDAS